MANFVKDILENRKIVYCIFAKTKLEAADWLRFNFNFFSFFLTYRL